MHGFDAALRACGVGEETLAPEEQRALDEDGYVVLAGLLDARALPAMRAAFEAAASDEATGTRHAEALLARATAFDATLTHPRVLAAVHRVLRRAFRLLNFGARDPRPGFGQQGLHTDWRPRGPAEPFHVVTALWLLDDFTLTNGATRVLPGSHRAPRPLAKPMQVPAYVHPEQRVVTAPAGAALVFNGHLWHSGTRNASTGPRRVLQCQFVARDAGMPGVEPLAAPARLSAAARAIVGG